MERGEQQRLALDELETGAEIARLAGEPREVLGHERDTLVSLIGAGPAVDLTSRQGDASRELGISLVQHDEAHKQAGRAGSDDECHERRRSSAATCKVAGRLRDAASLARSAT